MVYCAIPFWKACLPTILPSFIIFLVQNRYNNWKQNTWSVAAIGSRNKEVQTDELASPIIIIIIHCIFTSTLLPKINHYWFRFERKPISIPFWYRSDNTSSLSSLSKFTSGELMKFHFHKAFDFPIDYWNPAGIISNFAAKIQAVQLYCVCASTIISLMYMCVWSVACFFAGGWESLPAGWWLLLLLHRSWTSVTLVRAAMQIFTAERLFCIREHHMQKLLLYIPHTKNLVFWKWRTVQQIN